MKIAEKLAAKAADIYGVPTVNIAFFGDSVTQGCFDVYITSENTIQTYFDQENGYHTHLRKILSTLYPAAPVNIINAGISGDNATHALNRIERDVLRCNPDLCVVCFGLNDSNASTQEAYTASLGEIFDRLQAAGIEVIFMTPNMMCTKVSCHLEKPLIREVAASCAEIENSGKLERYLNAAKEVAKAKNVPVCDCYAKWKALAAAGVDTTELLANHINHPTEQLNWLFAVSLAEMMLGL